MNLFFINFFKNQVRDLQKKMQHVENDLDITIEKLTQTTTKLGQDHMYKYNKIKGRVSHKCTFFFSTQTS